MPPSLEDSWLDTTGAVGNFTFRYFLEDRQAVCFDLVAGDLPAAYQHPTRKYKLTSTRKTNLTRLLVVQHCRSCRRYYRPRNLQLGKYLRRTSRQTKFKIQRHTNRRHNVQLPIHARLR